MKTLSITIGILLTALLGGALLLKVARGAMHQSIIMRAESDLDSIGNSVLRYKDIKGKYPSLSEFSNFPLVQARPIEGNGEIIPSGLKSALLLIRLEDLIFIVALPTKMDLF